MATIQNLDGSVEVLDSTTGPQVITRLDRIHESCRKAIEEREAELKETRALLDRQIFRFNVLFVAFIVLCAFTAGMASTGVVLRAKRVQQTAESTNGK